MGGKQNHVFPSAPGGALQPGNCPINLRCCSLTRKVLIFFFKCSGWCFYSDFSQPGTGWKYQGRAAGLWPGQTPGTQSLDTFVFDGSMLSRAPIPALAGPSQISYHFLFDHGNLITAEPDRPTCASRPLGFTQKGGWSWAQDCRKPPYAVQRPAQLTSPGPVRRKPGHP